jgi:hypothetical protein
LVPHFRILGTRRASNGCHSQRSVFITAQVSDHLLIVEISLCNRYEKRCQCQCSSFCSFLQSHVGPNFRLNTLFSNTPRLCFSVYVRDQVSHPYETTDIIALSGKQLGAEATRDDGAWRFPASISISTSLSPCLSHSIKPSLSVAPITTCEVTTPPPPTPTRFLLMSGFTAYALRFGPLRLVPVCVEHGYKSV